MPNDLHALCPTGWLLVGCVVVCGIRQEHCIFSISLALHLHGGLILASAQHEGIVEQDNHPALSSPS
jgi:hypothetical protein